MQFYKGSIYSGPTRRTLRKLKTNTSGSFTVDGIVDNEEERAVYVRQKFTLRQYENNANALGDDHNYNYMSDQWVFEEEKGEFDVREGNLAANTGALLPTPFTGKHAITDSLLLNKTFKNVVFNPDNAVNFLDIQNRAQTQLAPLLCSELNLNNVTLPPIVKGISSYSTPEQVQVPLAMYGRYWFGSQHSMDAVLITNRTGKAPYFLTAAAAVGAANRERFSAYGFTPAQLGSGQRLKSADTILEVGDDLTAYITFTYDAQRDVYISESFEVRVPWPLNRGEVAAQDIIVPGIESYRTFTVPPIETGSTQSASIRNEDDITPYNYWVSERKSRIDLPAAAAITVGNVRDENLNSADYVPILLQNTPVPIVISYAANGNAVYPALQAPGSVAGNTDMFMFIPAFRIVKGNGMASIARPLRAADTETNMLLAGWESEPAMSTLVGGGADLTSQVPFWAFYEGSKLLKQHVSAAEHVSILNSYSDPPHAVTELSENTLAMDVDMWKHLSVAQIRIYDEARPLHRPLVCLQFNDNLPDYIEAQVQVIKIAVVDNRVDGGGAIVLANKEIMFLFREKDSISDKDTYTTWPKGYFRIRLDECNTFKTAAGAFEGEHYGLVADDAEPIIPANAHAVFRNALWNDRMIQIEMIPARGGFSLVPGVSPFRNEAEYTAASRLIGAAVGNAQAAATLVFDTERSGKPLALRSVFNFTAAAIEGRGAALVTPIPQGAAGHGLLSQIVGPGETYSNWQKYLPDNQLLGLYIPRKRDVANHFTGSKEITVECIEPFFGYSTGSSQLRCKHPMNTSKFGKNFPLAIQDYKYSYQNGSIVDEMRGYVKDPWTSLVVTSESDPEFTCISEKRPGVQQQNKDVSNIAEVSPTFNEYSQKYSPGSTALVKFSTRSGMFEYLFLYCKFALSATELSPQSDPVITQLEIRVRGRENQFVRVLDKYDIERLSRQNCHDECDWRTLHERGQGVLLHLSDIGLTEEIPFPRRKRIQLEISMLLDETEDLTQISLSERVFHVVLIRQNQLLQGGVSGCRFSFLNEQ